MKSSIKRSTAVAFSVVFFALGIRVGTMLDASGRFRSTEVVQTASGTILSDPEHQANVSVLWQTWNLLNERYIAPNDLTSEKLIEGAAAGLVKGVGDPYTEFLTAKEVKAFDESLNGKLEGIGAQLGEEKGLIIIAHPLKGSPAERAGLMPNDIIISVNGEDIMGWSMDEVISKVRGPQGTQAVLVIGRKGEPQPLTFTITREEIHVPSVESHVEKTATGSVGVIALHQFGERSYDEVREAILEFQTQKVQGIVLDLRGNGGGYLEEAVDITSLFVAKGIVVSVDRRDTDRVTNNVSGDVLEPTLPLVVLIDGGSASASEIVAGALQDNHRATIVGTKSFGKGTVQEIYSLPNGDSVKVTVARWITPNGKNLGKEGVHPDIESEFTSADVAAKNDVQLKAALHAIFTK